MTKQIMELQDMEQKAKDKKENASKWRIKYQVLEQEYSKAIHQSKEHQQKGLIMQTNK